MARRSASNGGRLDRGCRLAFVDRIESHVHPTNAVQCRLVIEPAFPEGPEEVGRDRFLLGTEPRHVHVNMATGSSDHRRRNVGTKPK